MSSISKSAKFIAFAFPVLVAALLPNYALAQSKLAELIEATELHEAVVWGGVLVRPSAHEGTYEGTFVSNPPAMIGATQNYSVGYPQGICSPIRTFDAQHSQFSVPHVSMPQPMMLQQSFQANITNQLTDANGFPAGFNLNDVGYAGPGDMRTHLWEGHSSDLQANGISHATLMSMPMASVQQWHNYFHGTEAAPRRIEHGQE